MIKFCLTLLTGFLFVLSSGFAQDFRYSLGPFSLLFNANDYATEGQRPFLNDPICYAITRQKRLAMIVEREEKVSAKEIKIETKKLTVEPYAFGINNEGKPILRGNVIEEKQIKEVTVKFAEDRFEKYTEEKRKGFFSGWFSSDKNKNIDLRHVSNLQVLEDSHFDIPKNYKGIKEENFQVICQLPFSN